MRLTQPALTRCRRWPTWPPRGRTAAGPPTTSPGPGASPGSSCASYSQSWVSARLLRAVPGPGGGYRLARPTSRISLLEVVEAVDGTLRGEAPLARERGSAP
jgi:hypothetical protein